MYIILRDATKKVGIRKIRERTWLAVEFERKDDG